VISVASQIGAFVRELRQARQISISQLAERAAVAKSTLSRWEAGAFQPRLPELEAVLRALGALPAQREQAIARVQAPRAVGALRQELAGGAGTAADEPGLLPAGGDLLRAMRHRRGLSQGRVAAHLRVRTSTVSFWEQSKTVPPAERLGALCDLLGAQPEERAVLMDGGRFLVPPLQETPNTLDRLEQALQTLRNEVYAGESRAIDLRFLILKSELAALAPRRRSARLLLTRVLGHYAEWLSWGNRLREAFRSADQVVEILRQERSLSPTARALPLAVHVLAGVTRGMGRPDSAAQAVELLRSWHSAGHDPGWESFLYREMADHAVDAGAVETALDFSRRAQSAAERTEDARAIRTSQKVQIRILIRASRYQEALALLPPDEDKVPLNGLFEALERAGVLLGLEEWDDAQRWVARAYELIAAYGYSHLRWKVDELAQRL
jgi:transcriptional regulator with XRE-family HTH domain